MYKHVIALVLLATVAACPSLRADAIPYHIYGSVEGTATYNAEGHFTAVVSDGGPVTPFGWLYIGMYISSWDEPTQAFSGVADLCPSSPGDLQATVSGFMAPDNASYWGTYHVISGSGVRAGTTGDLAFTGTIHDTFFTNESVDGWLATPEPAMCALIGAGLALAAARRRRRRQP